MIYSAHSLQAIRELGSWGTAEEIAGIAELIGAFTSAIPGRSWIGYTAAEVKRVQVVEEALPAVASPSELSTLVLEELSAFTVIYRAEAHHDLIGHMLTFSHALNIIYDLGYAALFQRGLRPLFSMIHVLRYSGTLKPGEVFKLVSPVDRLPLIQAPRSPELPIEKAYWKKDYSAIDWDFGHVFKFAASFYNHLGRVPEVKPEYVENFRYVTA